MRWPPVELIDAVSVALEPPLYEALFGSLNLCEPIFLGQTVNKPPVKRAPLTRHQYLGW